MRSKDDLKKEAEALGITVPDYWHTRDIMDAMRDKIGTFDPALQIDPAKAQDLKKKIDWAADDPFHLIASEYFTPTWLAEPKADGVRTRLFLGTHANTINSGRRSVKNFAYTEKAHHFPHLRDAVVPELAGTILDGELMPPAGVTSIMTGVVKGKEQWTKGPLNTVMAIFGSGPDKAVARQKEWGSCVFLAFDVLAINGESALHLPIETRREALEAAVELLQEKTPCIQIIMQMEANAENVLLAVENGFEGVILKRRGSRYIPGKRLSDWQKIKTMSAGDFFITGSNPGTGKNLGKVGSLKVAYWDPTREELSPPLMGDWSKVAEHEAAIYCADVSGMTDAFRDEVTDPATGKVKPELIGTVIEVMAQGVTKNRRLRHPHYKRSRPDKTPIECEPDASINLFTDV